MKQIERASIVRIVSDLIKADGIIDTREIEFLDVLREKYAITKEDEFLRNHVLLPKLWGQFRTLTRKPDTY